MLWNISLLFKVRMEQGFPKMQNAYKKYCYEKKPHCDVLNFIYLKKQCYK